MLDPHDGTNRLTAEKVYTIAKIFVNNLSTPRLRVWWDNAPAARRRAFLEAATGYAFFRFGASNSYGPRGTAGCELTPWVSMAVDQNVLPLGGIVAYDMPAPGLHKKGLGFAHDTGSAITVRRIDMYAGDGDAAYRNAMRVNTQGVVWLLLYLFSLGKMCKLFKKDSKVCLAVKWQTFNSQRGLNQRERNAKCQHVCTQSSEAVHIPSESK